MATQAEVPAANDMLPTGGERTQTRTAYLDEMAGSVLAGLSARGLILRDLRDLKATLEEYTGLSEQGPRQQGLTELEELQAQILGEEPSNAS